MNRGRKFLPRILAALLLLAVLLSALYWLSPSTLPRQPDSPPTAPDPVPPARTLAPPPAVAALPDAPTPLPPAPTAQGEIKPAQPAPQAPDRVVRKIVPQHLLLRFVDGSGAPIPEFRFRYALHDWDSLRRLERAKEFEFDREVGPEATPLEETADANGEFEFIEGKNAPKRGARLLRLRAAEAGLFLHGDLGRLQPRFSGTYDIRLPSFDKTTLVVQVSRSQEGSVVIRYADGLAYEGRVRIEAYTPDMMSLLYETRQVQANVPIRVLAPDICRAVGFRVDADREGFAADWSGGVTQADLARGAELLIPRDDRQCELALDLKDWPEGEPVRILVISTDGYCNLEATSTGGGRWRTLRIVGQGGLKEILVVGESGIWRSGMFVLDRSQRKEFAPLPGRPFSMQCRVLDADGRPIQGGFVSSLVGSVAPYDKQPGAGTIAGGIPLVVRTDHEGRAAMGNLPGPEFELEFDVKGFEPVRRRVTGQPGEVVDLGDVVMHPARGRVEFRLLNAVKGAGYNLTVASEFGSPIVAILPGIAAPARLEGLARRRYQVLANPGRGGQGVNIRFEVTDDELQVIEIDVGGLKEVKRK